MSEYPGAIDSFRTLVNLPGKDYDAGKETTIFAEDINGKADAIIAIETTLGENPQGDYDTVAERLDNSGGGGGGVGLIPPAGLIFNPAGISGNSSTNVASNNVVYSQFYIYAEVEIDEIYVYSSGSAGSANYGIYSVGSDGFPDELLHDLGLQSWSGTSTITIPVSITLEPGMYYLACQRVSGLVLAVGGQALLFYATSINNGPTSASGYLQETLGSPGLPNPAGTVVQGAGGNALAVKMRRKA